MRLDRVTPEMIREIMEEEELCSKMDAAGVARRLRRLPNVDWNSIDESLEAVKDDIDAGRIKQILPKESLEEVIAQVDALLGPPGGRAASGREPPCTI